MLDKILLKKYNIIKTNLERIYEFILRSKEDNNKPKGFL